MGAEQLGDIGSGCAALSTGTELSGTPCASVVAVAVQWLTGQPAPLDHHFSACG